jgi:hypothetical protein
MSEIMVVKTMKNPATDTKPTTITAYTPDHKLQVPYDFVASDPHLTAVYALVKIMGKRVVRANRTGDAPRGGTYSVAVVSQEDPA